MSETRDFSALKSSEGWTTVRRQKEAPRPPRTFAPRSSRFDIEQERRARMDAQKKAEEDRLRQAELNEVNFPSLGSAFAEGSKPANAWNKSGKELATAWRVADEEQETQRKAEEYLRRQEEERERRDTERYLSIPRFRSSVRNEDTYYEEEEEECNGGAGYAPPPRDDWETVQKKIKPRREQHHPVVDQEDPTVWEDDMDDNQNGDFDWSARPGRRNNDSLY